MQQDDAYLISQSSVQFAAKNYRLLYPYKNDESEEKEWTEL